MLGHINANDEIILIPKKDISINEEVGFNAYTLECPELSAFKAISIDVAKKGIPARFKIKRN